MAGGDSTIPVRVAVRCRPLTAKELQDGAVNLIDFPAGEPQILLKDANKAFTYDFVFKPDATQNHVYKCCVRDLIGNLFQGYNATVLAYGQTGSGKTHTMGTAGSGSSSGGEGGIIQGAVTDIFSLISEKNKNTQVKASFLEIYKEDVYDLLSEIRSKDIVSIREDFNGVKICGLTEVDVSTTETVIQLLEKGAATRSTGSTNMNRYSSRSHAIFTLSIQQTDCKTISKFHLVDLAGSERAKKTGAQGERLKEGININRGLLSLGNVISALCDNKSHIPYRDSKLTRLLQDSLGGNSHTVMVACISPADSSFEETLNTLRYADRARKIQNKPVVNVDPNSHEVEMLRQTIVQLEEKWGDHQLTCPLLQPNAVPSSFKTEETIADVGVFRQQLTILLEEYEDKLQDAGRDDETCPQSELPEFVRDDEVPNAEGSDPMVGDEEEDTTPNQSGNEEAYSKEKKILQQLAAINKELAVKEKRLLQVSSNQENLEVLRTCYEGQIHNMTEEIEKLRTEKNHLSAVAHAPNVASKVSEERRKKIQQLEQQIAALSHELHKKQRMLRVKEEVEKKSKALESEIMELKKSRVKFMKQVQKDAQRFKQLEQKLRRKEIQTDTLEMKNRQQQLKSSSENAVLRRKLEAAQSARRKLEQALNRQQLGKRTVKASAPSAEEIQQWITDELSVEVHKAEARRHLEHLKEDRAWLAKRLRQLEEEGDEPPPPKVSRDSWQEESKDVEKERLEKDLEERSTQISDLNEKLYKADSADPKERFSSIVRLDEARLFLSRLFETAAFTSIRVTELEREVARLREDKTQLAEDLQRNQTSYRIQLDEERLASDEKVLYLMQQIVTEPSKQVGEVEAYDDFKDREISRLGYLSEELVRKAEECQKLHQEVQSLRCSNEPNKQKASKHVVTYILPSDSETDDEDKKRAEKDPDWEKTPVQRRYKKKTKASDSRKSDEIEDQESVKGLKRTSSQALCKCKGKCHSKLCGCRKAERACTSSCQCLPEVCENREKENQDAATACLNSTFQIPESRILKTRNEGENLESTGVGLTKRRTIYRPINDSFFGGTDS